MTLKYQGAASWHRLNRYPKTMLALVAAIAFQTQDKPAVDHSAEPALKQLFANAGMLHGAHVVLTFYGKADGDYYLQNRTDDMWIGSNGELRLSSMSSMGDGSLIVTDGKTLMTDPLTDDDPIRLSKGGKALHLVAPREPMAFFLEGSAGYDALIDASSAITFTTASEGKKAIDCRAKDFGRVVIVYSDSAQNPLPERSDMFRSARRRDDGSEQPLATSKEFIRVVYVGPVKADLFKVDPPKGAKVEDNRNKPG